METVDNSCGNGSGVFVSVRLCSKLSRLFSRSSFYTKQERHDQPADHDVGSLKDTHTHKHMTIRPQCFLVRFIRLSDSLELTSTTHNRNIHSTHKRSFRIQIFSFRQSLTLVQAITPHLPRKIHIKTNSKTNLIENKMLSYRRETALQGEL